MQWTRAQRQAIEARGENLLVTAAAGSGRPVAELFSEDCKLKRNREVA